MQRIKAWFQFEVCGDCYRPIRCWNRRVSFDPERLVHRICWRRRRQSQHYSVYLQAISAEGQDDLVPGRYKPSRALRELRELTAMALELKARMKELEGSVALLSAYAGKTSQQRTQVARRRWPTAQ